MRQAQRNLFDTLHLTEGCGLGCCSQIPSSLRLVFLPPLCVRGIWKIFRPCSRTTLLSLEKVAKVGNSYIVLFRFIVIVALHGRFSFLYIFSEKFTWTFRGYVCVRRLLRGLYAERSSFSVKSYDP